MNSRPPAHEARALTVQSSERKS